MDNPQHNNQATPQSINSEQHKQHKESSKKPNHSQHNHDELDSDCEGCQQQKRQNQKLVDFYQRLDKISTKVKKFKSHQNVSNHQAPNDPHNLENSIHPLPKEIITSQNLQEKLKELNEKLCIPELPSVSQIKQFSSKEIGFELAAALIERQMKYKNENKKLQERINQLLAEKKKKQQNINKIQNTFFFRPIKNDPTPQLQLQNSSQTMIKDSLDDLKSNKRTGRKQKDDASFWDIDNTGTKNGFKYQETTFFETKKRNSIIGSEKTNFSQRKDFKDQVNQTHSVQRANEKVKNPYSTEQGHGLNLWLYQFKPEEYEDKIQSSWISDKNKSQVTQRYSNRINQKPSQANKSPRISNVNKTSIIQKNLINDYTPSVKNKRKNY